jgi:hypothetical protein
VSVRMCAYICACVCVCVCVCVFVPVSCISMRASVSLLVLLVFTSTVPHRNFSQHSRLPSYLVLLNCVSSLVGESLSFLQNFITSWEKKNENWCVVLLSIVRIFYNK